MEEISESPEFWLNRKKKYDYKKGSSVKEKRIEGQSPMISASAPPYFYVRRIDRSNSFQEKHEEILRSNRKLIRQAEKWKIGTSRSRLHKFVKKIVN